MHPSWPSREPRVPPDPFTYCTILVQLRPAREHERAEEIQNGEKHIFLRSLSIAQKGKKYSALFCHTLKWKK